MKQSTSSDDYVHQICWAVGKYGTIQIRWKELIGELSGLPLPIRDCIIKYFLDKYKKNITRIALVNFHKNNTLGA